MAAKDLFHELFKEILENDGWTVTHDPFSIKIGEVKFEVDLGAEKLIGAQKEKRKWLLKLKAFYILHLLPIFIER